MSIKMCGYLHEVVFAEAGLVSVRCVWAEGVGKEWGAINP